MDSDRTSSYLASDQDHDFLLVSLPDIWPSSNQTITYFNFADNILVKTIWNLDLEESDLLNIRQIVY